MATTSDIRNGLCIEMNNGLWQIIEFQHVKPGKGPAFVRTKLRNLSTGKVIDKTIPAGHKINDVRVERRTYQYLYNDDMGYHFMNQKTYDQVNLVKDLINAPQFLREGDNVEILFHANKEQALSCDLPAHVIMEITYTEPGVKGDTATNVTKPATVETGATVNVPGFIKEGDKIKIDTRNSSYVERVKK